MKAITTTYIGPTNTRGSRCRASDGDGNAVTMSWNSANNSEENHAAAARALCDKMEWSGELIGGTLVKGGRSVGMAWVWANSSYRA